MTFDRLAGTSLYPRADILIVTCARKPTLTGSVVPSVLSHGTGAININGSRIHAGGDNLNGGAYAENASDRHDGAENWRYKRGDIGGLAGVSFVPPTGGRWPANLVLMHGAGCMQAGAKQIQGGGGHGAMHIKSHGDLYGAGYLPQTRMNFRAEDGTESVTAWVCEPGCPVAELDRQSGGTVSPKTYVRGADGHNEGVYGQGMGESAGMTSLNYGDTGTASRYFKQMQAKAPTPDSST